MKTPKLKSNIKTYSSAFSKIDKVNQVFEIGNSTYYETLNNKQLTLDTVCEILPNANFNRNISASMKYKNEIDQEMEIIKYYLYNGSVIDMSGVISSIDIYIKNILNYSDFSTNTINNQKIYTKHFITQQEFLTIPGYETFIDSGINTISKAYGFGGAYKSHFPPNKIQPYFFYICNRYNAKPYISLISATEIVNQHKIQLADMYDLSTLEDDILGGKVILSINNEKYKSLCSNKTGLTNNLIHITFTPM